MLAMPSLLGARMAFEYMCSPLMTDTFFELMQMAVGKRGQLTSTPSADEWRTLLDMARKQAVVGVCKAALERLPPSQWPPQMITLEWSARCRKVELRNRKVNLAIRAITQWFERRGIRSCILKGQGNALMYPNPMMRSPGDIDIWVDGRSRPIIALARKSGIKGKACYHHMEWKPYGDVEVEVHYRPSFLFNPVHNIRLQKWFRQNAADQFAHLADLPDNAGEIAVPTFEFNAIFQLAHLSNHFFQEGIGMRQFADYYFLLTRNKEAVANRKGRKELAGLLSRFGLRGFAGAVMWVLGRVFLMEKEYMIVEPDKKRGLLLLEEIVAGGNFGKHDARALSGRQPSSIRHNIARIYRDIRLCRLFPSECLWEPCFRLWHFGWRCLH